MQDKNLKKSLDNNAPWLPSKYKDKDVYAIQALAQGEADADQQTQIIDWILNNCCKTYDMSYRANNQFDTAFAEGKRYVGNELIKLMKIKPGKLQKG